ncbi:MAG: hypothetical protein ACJAZ9_001675 [Neolewinella sp.]|jgi:uncharacterized protein YjbI with pentapeptide repeats
MAYHTDETFNGLTELASGEYDNCNFENCSLAGTDLSGLVFVDCTFSDCDLSNAKVNETAFKTVDFENCKLLGIHFDDSGKFLFAINFTGCRLELATFRDRDIRKCTFTECQLPETDFTGANLQGVNFNNCDLNRAIFERTDLRKADFTSAYNYRLSPEDNRIRGAKFSTNGLVGLLTEYGVVVR